MLFSRRSTHAPLWTDFLLAACALWFIVGLFIDGWAHNNIRAIETFFTPWHAAFYSGFGVTAAALIGVTWARKRRGMSWLDAVPAGYEWSLLGTAIFAVGGAGDMTWHIVFGVEADLEALLSPTHLLLATGMTLILSGPMLSWMSKPKPSDTIAGQAPMMLSASMTAAILTFMTQFSHFIDRKLAGGAPDLNDVAQLSQTVGVTGVLLPTAFVFGVAFFALRRGRTAFGFFTLLLASQAYGMGMMRDGLSLLPAAIAAGGLIDVLLYLLPPLGGSGWRLRAFTFAAPAIFFALYVLSVIGTSGSWWTIHLWAGLPVIAGLAGLLLGLLAWPPRGTDQ